MSKITLKVNGRTHAQDVEPGTPLLYILRNDLGLQGPKFGCGLGQCGACTVIVNGAAKRSCVTPTSVGCARVRLAATIRPGKSCPPRRSATGHRVRPTRRFGRAWRTPSAAA